MPNCLVCNRKLQPKTHVPRWNEEMLADEKHRQYYEAEKAARAEEIRTGKLGYLGEGHFCNVQCAAFFARGVVAMIENNDPNLPTTMGNILPIVQRILGLYNWVVSRRNGA